VRAVELGSFSTAAEALETVLFERVRVTALRTRLCKAQFINANPYTRGILGTRTDLRAGYIVMRGKVRAVVWAAHWGTSPLTPPM
jgi:hypothetical protein